MSSKTFKRSKGKRKSSKGKRKSSKGKKTRKQRGGSPGSSLYRNIPKEATFSDVMPNPLE